MQAIIDRIFNVDQSEFESLALEIFHYQYNNCDIYRQYVDLLKINPREISVITEIPFLPIGFFKTHKVVSTQKKEQIIFTSSGTTGMERSRHFVADLSIYERSFVESFKHFYGNPAEYTILAFLPSYLEREGSSLIYMMEALIKMSGHEKSGFYLHNVDELLTTLVRCVQNNEKTLLLGVSFALLDLAENHTLDLQNIIVMETGGMKGKRKEMVREEIHEIYKTKFNVNAIHSEYGMTELLTQAYSTGDGLFACPPWMRVLVRDAHDPRCVSRNGAGGLNIIDLANVNSCAFVETKDLGRIHQNGRFEVNGRFDFADIRGCNLLVSE